jgi:formylglycine-generating enzyme required for sulfatase activity
VPGHPTLVAAIATGHHGTPRSGRLLLIDPARGRHEAEGIVQEIPGRGKRVEPIVKDRLIDGVWPQFLQPWPLNEKYFLVSMKPTPDALWGIYLVDVFDNMTLVKEVEDAALLDPILLAPRPAPPVIPDRIDPAQKTATVHIQDIYRGPGLAGIPRGTVKRLRVGSYYFSPRKTGGLLGTVGMDGPWDIKRILGTVPVAADGSAYFTIPANTPIFVQPLDGPGRALQLMRSWFVGMPGEFISCVGCHEPQNSLPPSRNYSVAGRTPQAITPWHGPERNFDFQREVQPVLDQRCIGCHDGAKATPDLRGDKLITGWSSQIAGHAGPGYGGRFSAAYAELHRFVRRPGIESDLHPLTPMEYFAETTELVQLLRKGHHGVSLTPVQWEVLFTWIDLNAPYHGTRSAMYDPAYIARINTRARELSLKYAGVAVDYEKLPPAPPALHPVVPQVTPEPTMPPPRVEGWPFDPAEAARRSAGHAPITLDLGSSVTLELVYIPAGEFVMGGAAGHPDERPLSAVRIERGFWMGRTEVTNAQFARFNPAHDSRNEARHGYQFGRLGYPVNGSAQPAVRVSWREASDFCDWLAARTGRKLVLPTEAQWEWACRAGRATPFFFGPLDADYTAFANLGDRKLKDFAACTARGNYTLAEVITNPNRYDDWIPRDDRFDDGGFVSENVARYRPNPWGLFDMHGNVWEWTRSVFKPYPYREDDGRNPPAGGKGWRVVRGGSWYDRPQRCTASYRLAYPDFEKVFNVGFRVVIEQ